MRNKRYRHQYREKINLEYGEFQVLNQSLYKDGEEKMHEEHHFMLNKNLIYGEPVSRRWGNYYTRNRN